MNAVVKLLRERAPKDAARYSDEDLTLMAGDAFRGQGVLDLEEAYPDFRDQYLRLRTERSPGVASEAMTGLKVGVLDKLPQATYGLGAAIAGGVGLEGAENFLLGEAKRNAQEAAERSDTPRGVERFEDINVGGPTEQAARFIRWAVPTFTENVPSMVPTVGAGLAGGAGGFLVGGPPGMVVGAAAGAGLTSMGQEAGAQFAELANQDGVDRSKARQAALLYGSAAGAVDAVGAIIPVLKLSPAGSMLAKKLGKSAVSRIAVDVLERGGLRGAITTAGVEGVTEGATELIQEAINMAGEEYATGRPIAADEYRSRLLNAAAAGGLVGAGMGGAVGLRGSSRSETDELPGDDDADDPEVSALEAAKVRLPGSTLLLPPTREDEVGPSADEIARMEAEGGAQARGPVTEDGGPNPVIELPPSSLPAVEPTAIQPTTTEVSNEGQEGQGQGLQEVASTPIDLRTDMVSASRAIPLVSNWKPARLARATSTSEDPDAGRFAIALEKDGTVHVRNVYARKDGKMVAENADDLLPAKGRRGPGRDVESLKEAGFTVLEQPFQLSRVSPDLRVSMPLAQWQETRAAAGRVEQGLAAAIDEGRADEAGAAILNLTSPETAAAIELLRDAALAEAPDLSPRQLMYGFFGPIESMRETLKRVGEAQQGEAAEILSSKDGKVLGLFKPEDFAKFARFALRRTPSEKVKGLTKAEVMLLKRVSGGEVSVVGAKRGLAAWARAMAELGAQRQSGVYTQAGTRTEIDENTAATEAVAPAGPSMRMQEFLTEAFAAITSTIPGKPSLEKFKAAYAVFAREHMADLKRLSREGDVVGNIAKLYEAWTQADTAEQFVRKATAERGGDRGAGGRAGAAPSGRSGPGDAGRPAPTLQPDVPAALQERLNAPAPAVAVDDALAEVRERMDAAEFAQMLREAAEVDAESAYDLADKYGLGGVELAEVLKLAKNPALARASRPASLSRATGEAVRRAFGRVTSILAAAGVDVRVLRESEAGGVFDGDRLVTLHLKDILEPTVTDMRVAVHEAVHVLFKSVPEAMRFRIENGVMHWFESMPEEARKAIDEGNLSIADARNVSEWLEERLAAALEMSSVPEARSVAQAVWAWIKEVYLRIASSVATALGRTGSAEGLALRWFMQRFERMLAGELPDGFIETAGGPIQDLKQVALRVFGLRPESVRTGGIDMVAPDSPQAIEFNLHASRYSNAKPASEWDLVPLGTEFYKAKSTLPKDAAPVVNSPIRSLVERDPIVGAKRMHAIISTGLPERVSVPLLGKDVRILYPEPRGPRELNDYQRRAYHFITRSTSEQFMPRQGEALRADGVHRIADTLENGQAVLRQPDGTRMIVRRYLNGLIHAVVVREGVGGLFVDTQFWVGATATLRGATIEGKRKPSADVDSGGTSESPTAPRPDSRISSEGELGGSSRPSQERRSRPVQPEPLGNRDNLANAIHLNVAAINHALDTEAAVAEALSRTGTLAGAAQARGVGVLGYFRELFGLSDPEVLKQQALQRVDPTTGDPVAGVNDGQRFEHFRHRANADRSRIMAYDAVWQRKAEVSRQGREAAAETERIRKQLEHRQDRLTRALKDYLNADGLAAEISRGIRRMLSAERWTADRANTKMGAVEQALRELDPEATKSSQRMGEYQSVFNRVFKQAMGLERRRLFDALDALVSEANLDLDRPIGELRLALAEKQAATGSPELAKLIGNTREANALLALFVAYGRSNQRVLADLERRRLRTAEERNRLQRELEALATTRADVDQAIRRLPKQARLEERVKAAYQAERQRHRALEVQLREQEVRTQMAAAALPVYQRAQEELARAFNLMPHVSFGDGMVYHVPANDSATGASLRDEAATRKVSLNSEGVVTDQATLRSDLEKMTAWLGRREERAAQGDGSALDSDYFAMKAERDAILTSGYFEADVRKLDTVVKTLSFQPVGRITEAFGTAAGRRIKQRFNRETAIMSLLRAEGQRRGAKNDRLRQKAMDVLNRGVRPEQRINIDRYFDMFVDPAASRLEKERGLLELGLSDDIVKARIWQKILNELLADPATAVHVRGKEREVYQALQAHLDGMAETSAWFNAQNEKYGLGVKDARLITETLDGRAVEGIRDSLPQGVQTFSRRTSRKLRFLFDAMAKGETSWADFRTGMEAAMERYLAGDRNGAQAALAPYFRLPAVWRDFVGELATTDTYSAFEAPAGPDGAVRGEADPALVAMAYQRTAPGDIVGFIEAVHALHGGESAPGLYLEQTLQTFERYFKQVADILNENEPGITGRHETIKGMVPGVMIDARVLERWPTGWSEYLAFDAQTNHNLITRIAAQVAFGRDQEGLGSDFETLRNEVDAMVARLEAVEREEKERGGTPSQIEARVVRRLGKAEHKRLQRARELQPYVKRSMDMVLDYYSSKHTDLGATRWATALVQTMAGMLLNQPGSALMQFSEMFSPLIESGLSGSTLKQVLRNWRYFGEDLIGSLAQGVGLELFSQSRLSRLYNDMGLGDPAVQRKFVQFTEDGVRSDIFADMGRRNESGDIGIGTRILRRIPRLMEIPVNLRGERAGYTVLRPLAPFTQATTMTNRALTLSLWRRVEDMVAKGLEYFEANPLRLEDPTFTLDAEKLGLKGLEARTFDTLAAKMAEGYGLEITEMVRQARARLAGAQTRGDQNLLLDETQRGILHGLAMNEISMEGNLATMSPRAFTQTALRLALPLWGWPIRRAMQVVGLRLDEKGRFQVEALGRGLLALGVATGIGMAYSILLDEYHERILRKARNLRSAKNLFDAPNAYEALMTILEASNRVGTFGILGDVANGLTNMAAGEGDNRTFSLDQRVVAVNSLLTLSRGVSSLIAQGGDADYSNVVRPVLQSMGGGGLLQYMQIANNAFDLNNVESRVTARINAQNYLRVAGRMTGLEVRKAQGGGAMPNEMTPVMNRMVLAALVGDRATFQTAWRAAIDRAREMGREDPAGFVRDSFRSRHPLRNVFRSLRESEYRDLLGAMDDDGKQDVMEAVNNFNRFGALLGVKPYTGTAADEPKASKSTSREAGMSLRGLTVPALGTPRIY